MKIGILTYHSVYNFGANLQAYSTVCYLRNKGYDPLIINWIPEELEKGYDKNNPPEQAKAHKEFIRNKLPISKLCRTDDDIIKVIDENNIDAIIIGSDAVLQHHTLISRIRITKKGIKIKEKRSNTIFPNPFWGSFIFKSKRKIPVMVMSASSQNTRYHQIRGKLRKRMAEALSQFSVITVRDSWTQKMIQYLSYGALNPIITPDPVFAFNNNVHDNIDEQKLKNKYGLKGKYILLSFKNEGVVDKRWLKGIERIAEKTGSSVVILTMPGGIIFRNPPLKTIGPPLPPLDWYGLIKYSSGYIGENMHPIVVSLHNVVPFFSFDNYGIIRYKYFVQEKSSKIYDLLSIAGFLENRVTTLGKYYKMPEPHFVMDRLAGFDIERCRSFSYIQQENYRKMMEKIIQR